MAKMNWDRVHAQDNRRKSRLDSSPTFLRPSKKRSTVQPKFKVKYAISCDACHKMIEVGQFARYTVIGKLVHGYGCGADAAVCATCKRPIDKDNWGTTNKRGVMVHAHGCPKKPATTTE